MPDKQEIKNNNEATDNICDMNNFFQYLSSGIPLTREKVNCIQAGGSILSAGQHCRLTARSLEFACSTVPFHTERHMMGFRNIPVSALDQGVVFKLKLILGCCTVAFTPSK